MMDRVELDSTVWKSDLLNGRFDLNVAKVLGETLATWHLYGESNPANIAQFKEDTLFEQLRVDPFYRFVAKRNPDLQTVIGGLINELETEHTTIVHGDFSPKILWFHLLGRYTCWILKLCISGIQSLIWHS